MSSQSLKSIFDSWKKENDQHGKQAFPRFVMLNFLRGLESVSDEFIFKGGNLLWHYIKTPRATIDLDLSTITLKSHQSVKDCFNKSFEYHDQIKFSIKKYSSVNSEEELGAKVIIAYKAESGQKNTFSVDVVYALPTDISKVKSSLGKGTHKSASIENIIADKVHASYRFRGGNTRMKDFDDLWRISKSTHKISKSKLKILFKEKEINFSIEPSWADYMKVAWMKHSSRYADLPKDINVVFEEINKWLEKLK